MKPDQSPSLSLHNQGHALITPQQEAWLDKLRGTLNKLVETGELLTIARASSCRELWIQGELFLAGFRIGEIPLWKGKKPHNKRHSRHIADFHAPDHAPVIVGEIKFLWTLGFMEKGIDLAGCLTKTRNGDPLEVKDLPEDWGPLSDYPRLRKAPFDLLGPEVLRVMVLVLARVQPNKRDELGILLEEMELANTQPLEGFPKTEQIWVRAWVVEPMESK